MFGLVMTSKVQIECKGIIAVKAKSGTEKLIHDVCYIPGLAQTLLSVGQLIQRGYSVLFHVDACEIRSRKFNVPLVKIRMAKNINKMFSLEISCLDDYALVANVRDD